jgi:protease-4
MGWYTIYTLGNLAPQEVSMKKVILVILAIFGLLSIMAVAVIAVVGMFSYMAKPGVPSNTILEANFEKPTIEVIPDDPLAELMLKGHLQIRDVVEALDKAATDKRVKGLVAKIGAGGMGMAHTQEIRDAVIRFRASGKPAYAWAETFGEFGPGNGGYYLATAFDEIYLQPSGDVGLTGLMYESMFIRGTLDKLDVEPRMDHRYEYKNAMNMYTERSYTEAHREAMETILESQFGQLLRGIAEKNGISEEEARELIDRGPFLGAEALDAGLVDGLRYRDEVYDMVREETSEYGKLLYINKYLDRAGRPHSKGETIALIHGYGAVMRGASGYSPIDGSVIMGSDCVSAAFREAIDDDRVKAIIFRVDSPGGSYVASDTIWRETVRAREAGKPVIVTMGNVAGSGGYFVAMSADKIVAQPGTITASIGVLAGKMLTSGFWEKLGVSWDDVQSSAHSSLYTGTHDYSRSGYERFQAMLDRIYEDFTQKVADGREVPLEEVLEIARGRIWSGEDAKELGLVDELGGYDTALRLAREAIGLEPDADVRLKVLPRRRSPMEKFFGEEPESSEAAVLQGMARTLEAIEPAARLLQQLGLTAEPQPLSMRQIEATP